MSTNWNQHNTSNPMRRPYIQCSGYQSNSAPGVVATQEFGGGPRYSDTNARTGVSASSQLPGCYIQHQQQQQCANRFPGYDGCRFRYNSPDGATLRYGRNGKLI